MAKNWKKNAILWLSVLSVLSLITYCAGKIEYEITTLRSDIQVGMDRGDIESYLAERGYQYDFTDRQSIDGNIPPFRWKSESAIGLIGAVKRGFPPRLLICGEAAMARVEIDVNNKVSGVHVNASLTCP